METIKNEVFTRGYTYDQFLTLDHRMQRGSRQLLLCLGWLVYHLRIIEKAMEQCLKSESVLDYDDTSSLYQVRDSLFSGDGSESLGSLGGGHSEVWSSFTRERPDWTGETSDACQFEIKVWPSPTSWTGDRECQFTASSKPLSPLWSLLWKTHISRSINVTICRHSTPIYAIILISSLM